MFRGQAYSFACGFMMVPGSVQWFQRFDGTGTPTCLSDGGPYQDPQWVVNGHPLTAKGP